MLHKIEEFNFGIYNILYPLSHSSKTGSRNEIWVHKFLGHDKEDRILTQKL